QKAEQLKCSLTKNADNYLVKEYFFDSEIGKVYGSADFVIARAGAHTVYELVLLNKPAILIPIPWSTGGEQQKNAEMLEKAGLAKVLSQSDLESGKLWQTIQDFSRNLKKYVLKQDFSLPTDATQKIIKEIKKIVFLC
ncbi:MAG: glycosyltransferase, partial [Microgenomates group bacterium]